MAAVDRYLVLGAGHDLEQKVRRVPEDIVALLPQIGADSATAARRIALRQIADDERRAGLPTFPILERRPHTRSEDPQCGKSCTRNCQSRRSTSQLKKKQNNTS